MSKRIVVLFALFAGLTLSGCDQLRSPTGLLELAFQAVHKENLPVLQTTLKGDALAQYGNRPGLTALRGAIQGQKLEVAHVWLKESLLGHKDVRGTYVIKVRDRVRNVIALKATEFCFYGKPPRGYQDIEPNWDRCWVTQLEFVQAN